MSSNAPPPTLTSAQTREVDRLTAERYRIPVGWLMEAAGWQVARHCGGRAYVVCGKGNNGGDGLAAARHLHRWGRLEGVACLDQSSYRGSAADELAALQAAGAEVDTNPNPRAAVLVVDALLGTGISRPAEGPVAEWIQLLNGWGRRVVAVDVPSGLDADSGDAHGACVRAALTVTLGLPKPGLLRHDGPAHAGEVWVADIGIPTAAFREVGIEVPSQLFAMHDRVELSALRP